MSELPDAIELMLHGLGARDRFVLTVPAAANAKLVVSALTDGRVAVGALSPLEGGIYLGMTLSLPELDQLIEGLREQATIAATIKALGG